MSNCENCKSWKAFIHNKNIPNQAPCEKLSESPEIYKNHSFVAVNLTGLIDEIELLSIEGEEIFETGKNFGCIHFEQK